MMPSLERLLAMVDETRRKHKPLIEQARKQKLRRRSTAPF